MPYSFCPTIAVEFFCGLVSINASFDYFTVLLPVQYTRMYCSHAYTMWSVSFLIIFEESFYFPIVLHILNIPFFISIHNLSKYVLFIHTLGLFC